jgi:hypothetical protein
VTALEPVAVLPLTEFQAEEVGVGLDIDLSDGKAPWGFVVRRGRKTFRLEVVDAAAAIYRITNSRDIFADNAGDSMSLPGERLAEGNKARSLDSLVTKLVAALGGREGVPEEVRRWL